MYSTLICDLHDSYTINQLLNIVDVLNHTVLEQVFFTLHIYTINLGNIKYSSLFLRTQEFVISASSFAKE